MSEHGELREGVHVFRTRDEMWEWLNAHGFEEEGGYGDDGSQSMTAEPEGWAWEVSLPWERPMAALIRDDNDVYFAWDMPEIDHRGEQ